MKTTRTVGTCKGISTTLITTNSYNYTFYTARLGPVSNNMYIAFPFFLLLNLINGSEFRFSKLYHQEAITTHTHYHQFLPVFQCSKPKRLLFIRVPIKPNKHLVYHPYRNLLVSLFKFQLFFCVSSFEPHDIDKKRGER